MSYHKNLRGGDLHAPSQELIENNTGTTLTKLKVVTLNGMGTVYPQVKIATPVDVPFGVVNTDISTGKSGIITCLGFMTEIDTSPWVAGTSLFADISGNLTSTITNEVVGTVIKQDATYGIVYVFCLMNFINASSVASTSWDLHGNAGTDASNFIGTLDAQPLRIRTNNTPVAQFDAGGRFGIGPDSPLSSFHLKPFTGYNEAGLRIDSFTVTTNSTALNNIYALTLTDGSVVKVTLETTGRQSDGLARASFTRSALFYKEGGNVQIQGMTWQSDFTSKSDSAFDIKYAMGINTVTFKVKAADTQATYWTGNIKVEVIKTDA